MLGLCTICNSPVGRNQEFCRGCIGELEEARLIMEMERAGEADACYLRWMAGAAIYMPTPAQGSAETEPIRQPDTVWCGESRRIKRDEGDDARS